MGLISGFAHPVLRYPECDNNDSMMTWILKYLLSFCLSYTNHSYYMWLIRIINIFIIVYTFSQKDAQVIELFQLMKN